MRLLKWDGTGALKITEKKLESIGNDKQEMNKGKAERRKQGSKVRRHARGREKDVWQQ